MSKVLLILGTCVVLVAVNVYEREGEEEEKGERGGGVEVGREERHRMKSQLGQYTLRSPGWLLQT